VDNWVECCTQIKQDECNHFTVNHTNDVIPNTDHAVSVLSWRRFADWFDRNSLWCSAWAVNRVSTIRSTILEASVFLNAESVVSRISKSRQRNPRAKTHTFLLWTCKRTYQCSLYPIFLPVEFGFQYTWADVTPILQCTHSTLCHRKCKLIKLSGKQEQRQSLFVLNIALLTFNWIHLPSELIKITLYR